MDPAHGFHAYLVFYVVLQSHPSSEEVNLPWGTLFWSSLGGLIHCNSLLPTESFPAGVYQFALPSALFFRLWFISSV